MVLTHKSMSKKVNVVFKPTDPKRKFMSKAEVLAQKEVEKEKARRLKEAEEKINEELGINSAEENIVVGQPKEEEKFIPKQHANQSVGERKAELEAIRDGLKGPGSKAKKEAIQAELDKLV